MKLIAVAALLLVLQTGTIRGGEWLTTRGEYCIDKCRYHGDEYYFYWCHVGDPSLKFSDGSSWGWGYQDNSPDTHLKWDYCVPSEIEQMDQMGNYINNHGGGGRGGSGGSSSSGSRPGINDQNRNQNQQRKKRSPEEAPNSGNNNNNNNNMGSGPVGGNSGGNLGWNNNGNNNNGNNGNNWNNGGNNNGNNWNNGGNNNGNGGNNNNNGGNNDWNNGNNNNNNDWNNNNNNNDPFGDSYINPKGPASALYPFTPCTGPCQFSRQRPVCNVNSQHPMTFVNGYNRQFYCVNEEMPLRQQLSSQNRMWCLDICKREAADHYWCNTLYGHDHCSPTSGVSSVGTRCAYPCELWDSTFEAYHFCYTAPDNSTWEYCGQWDVPEEKKRVIEFTRYDYVCGDYCKPDEDNEYEWCYHVYWDYNYTLNEGTLHKTWDYCRWHVPQGLEGWEIGLIVLGVIGAIIGITIAIVYCTK